MFYIYDRNIPGVVCLDSICRIEKLLACGGMSSVYLATGKGECEGMPLAVKSCEKGGRYEAALKKEYDILRSVDNIHVPKVYGLFDYKDQCTGDIQTGIVMEYVCGKSLSDVLNKDFTDKDVFREDYFIFDVITSLCSVLSYLHSMRKPVYYCDVKPDNIIISNDIVKVIDFGSACTFRSGADSRGPAVSDNHIRYGTLSYAAPEQFDTEGVIDARTDIYGVGRLLSILCERYGKKTKNVNKIIKRCLYEERTRRYADVAEFMYDFLIFMRKSGVTKPVIIYR